MTHPSMDGVLIQWGDRLFYPANRQIKSHTPRLHLPGARAAEIRRVEFADHRYVMVLHDHQAHPHVHLSVKAASKQGKRLNPRKADLQRWRETFAERLRERGIDAQALPQITRGASAHRTAVATQGPRERAHRPRP